MTDKIISKQSCTRREALLRLNTKYKKQDKALCEEASSDLILVSNEEMTVGEMLIKLVENKYIFASEGSRKYWARILCEAASEIEDAPGLLATLKSPELEAAHTAARKAFRIIDFITPNKTVGDSFYLTFTKLALGAVPRRLGQIL